MRLMRCRKCGTIMATENTILENMMDKIDELTEKAYKCKRQSDKQIYLEQIKVINKMMTSIRHTYAQIDERKMLLSSENAEIVRYIRSNHLITDEKLDELREIAKQKAKEKNEKDQKEIERVYGTYKSTYDPFNRTKSDPTANAAIH